jgi:hypothetical protein
MISDNTSGQSPLKLSHLYLTLPIGEGPRDPHQVQTFCNWIKTLEYNKRNHKHDVRFFVYIV